MKISKIPSRTLAGVSVFTLLLTGGIVMPGGASAEGGAMQSDQSTQETQVPGAEQPQAEGAFSGEATSDVQQTEIPGATDEQGSQGMEGGEMGSGLEGGEQPNDSY